MATASKSRRAAMVTPPSQSRAREASGGKTYTIAERQLLLDNFDLEVEDKLRAFQTHLTITLQSFAMRQDSEIFRIPRELRQLTVRDLRERWGGSLGGTVARMKREQIEAEERVRIEKEEEERKVKEKEAKGKRKLEEGESSPGNARSKNARKDGTSKSATGKRKPPSAKKGKSAPSRTSSSQPSTLPQNHIFNPLLPPTPKMPRAPRRGESLLSINGSPLAHDEDATEGESDDELPDPEAYEAKLVKSQPGESNSRSKTTTTSTKTKTKRGPSLMIRQSIGPSHPTPAPGFDQEVMERGDGLCTISTSDGRIITFDPFAVDPGRMEDEMRESGLEEDEIQVAAKQIQQEVVKALTSRLGTWGISK